MNKKRKSILTRFMSLVAVIGMLFTMITPMGAMAKEKSTRSGSQSLAQYLGYDPAGVVNELTAHQGDAFYLTTPYRGLDITNPMPLEKHMSPNGSSYNTPLYGAGMNCTGFVGYVLQTQGADLNKTTTGRNNVGGYVNVYNWLATFKQAGVDMVPFNSASELLASGMANKGDVIIMDPLDHNAPGADGHIGFFWGDNSSDNKFWHSAENGNNHISAITPKSEPSTFYLFRSSGKLQIAKKSANPSITKDNKCYTLAGAKFNVYAKGTNNVVGVLTTEQDGKSNQLSLTPGEYEIQEAQAPNGYILPANPPRYAVTVSSGQLNDYYVNNPIVNEPGDDPIRMLVGKLDEETGLGVPQGGGNLSNAEFTVWYYDAQYKSEDEIKVADATPKRTWVFKTNEQGVAFLDSAYKVGGDELYSNLAGQTTVPWGTLVIQETKAPEGYLLETADGKAPEKHIRNIEHDVNGATVREYNTPEQPDQIKRGDFEFNKIANYSAERMKNVKWEIISDTTSERGEFVTDENGYYSSASNFVAHDAENGLWFGEKTALDNGKGALPYDTYTINELRCEANEGYKLLKGIKLVISRDNYVVKMGTLTNDKDVEPSIETLFVTTDGKKEFDPTVDQKLVDKVTQIVPENKVGTELFYVTQFHKIDKDGRETVLGEVVSSYTSKATEETFDVVFEYKAGTLLDGEKLVATHIAYTDKDHKDEYIRHYDLENEKQTLVAKTPSTPETPTKMIQNVQTGDKVFLIVLSVVLILGGIIAFILGKRKK